MVNTADSSEAMEFQGKDVNEEFQFCFHQHWIRLVWPFSRLIIQNAAIAAVAYMSLVTIGIDDAGTRRLVVSVLVGVLFFSHIGFITSFYKFFLYVIIVTDKKVHRIKKTLVAINDHQSVDLWMLQDINKCQHGIIQNLLGFGSLILEAQDTTLRLHFVPNVNKKYVLLMHLRERARSSLSQTARVIGNQYLQRPQPIQKKKPKIAAASRKEALYWGHAEIMKRLPLLFA